MSNVTPVKGYTELPQWKLERVNANKESEERILRLLELTATLPDVDPRRLAIAKTHFEDAFMAWNRAIMNPQRISLPEDGED